MDSNLEKIMEKGWGQMEKTLDQKLPEKKPVRISEYKSYYTAALILLIAFVIGIIAYENNIDVFKRENKSGKMASILKTDHWPKDYSKQIQYSKNKIRPTDKYQTGIKEIKLLINPAEVKHSDIQAKVNYSEMERNHTNEADYLLPRPVAVAPSDRLALMIYGNNSFHNDLQNFSNDKNPRSSQFKHNTISVSLNSVNQNFASFEGLDGGINYSYKLNKNFGFMTGIEQSLFSGSRFDYDLGILQQAIYHNSDIENSSEISMTTDLNKGNSAIQYYVGVPVGVLYSIDKFTVSAGIKISYLLNSQGDPEINSGYNNQVLAMVRTNYRQNEPFVNKFDYSFILGFEVNIIKDFSLFSKLNYAQSRVVNSYGYNQNTLGDLFLVSGQESEKPAKGIYFGMGIKYDIAKK